MKQGAFAFPNKRKTDNYSTSTTPSSLTTTRMPVLTVSRNSSPSLSTTGIFAPVHTSPKIAPEAASESIGWEKSMQAGCLPMEQAV